MSLVQPSPAVCDVKSANADALAALEHLQADDGSAEASASQSAQLALTRAGTIDG